MNKKLGKIRKDILQNTKLPLFAGKDKLVFGEGDSKARIMFIGEAPGAEEEKEGRPFCGRAGKILNKLLDSINLKRSNVYITNLLKFRPPKNRQPNQKEIKAYAPYLDEQIKAIKPKVIVCLGQAAWKYILKKYSLAKKIKNISLVHGKIFKTINGPKIIPLYHPAVAVYNVINLKKLKKDFKIIKKTI